MPARLPPPRRAALPAPPAHLARRHLLGGAACLALGGLGGLLGAGCASPPPLLRIGTHPWAGYQLLFLARAQGRLDADLVRLVELPSASASLRALAAGTLDGAGLTLDEVLGARARGLMLRVVAVFDESNGADVLLAAPGLTSLPALRGRRIGVEQTATGALMLDAALTQAGLLPADVRQVPLPFNEHAGALRSGRVDALVTFEPARSQLLADGAQVLFSSAQVPGLIVDVLAVRPQAADAQAEGLRMLVAGLLQARDAWQRDPAGHAPGLSARLQLPPEGVLQAFSQLLLPDLAANRQWLAGPTPKLQASAARLVDVMQGAALLPAGARPLTGAHSGGAAPLADARFLPP